MKWLYCKCMCQLCLHQFYSMTIAVDVWSNKQCLEAGLFSAGSEVLPLDSHLPSLEKLLQKSTVVCEFKAVVGLVKHFEHLLIFIIIGAKAKTQALGHHY